MTHHKFAPRLCYKHALDIFIHGDKRVLPKYLSSRPCRAILGDSILTDTDILIADVNVNVKHLTAVPVTRTGGISTRWHFPKTSQNRTNTMPYVHVHFIEVHCVLLCQIVAQH